MTNQVDADALEAMIGPLNVPDDLRFWLFHMTSATAGEFAWAARMGGQKFYAFGKTAAAAAREAAERFNDGLENGDYPSGNIPKIRRRK